MHKSTRTTTTFVLLASSLVMLAVMPSLNQNNGFSNTAMAQQYYDDNYGDSSYSQYPTDDKKYECRTGPFEGFFVSSVEFCQHFKFDKEDNRKDIRDNRTGTKGPTGDKGPSGTAQLNFSKFYSLLGNIATTGTVATSQATSQVFCDPGDFLVDGNFVITSHLGIPNPGTVSTIQDGAIIPNVGPNEGVSVGYLTTLQGANLNFTTTAGCYDNFP